MNLISEKILQYLVRCDVIDKSEEALEYYKYGIEITLSSALNIILIILIGLISKCFKESLVFLICFVPLRQFTGGYHADSYFKCNTMFSALFILLLIVYKYTFFRIKLYGCILLFVFSMSVIISECPAENSNKPLTPVQRRINKIMPVILGLLYGITGVILKVLSYDIGAILLYTLILISLLVIAAALKRERGERNEKGS